MKTLVTSTAAKNDFVICEIILTSSKITLLKISRVVCAHYNFPPNIPYNGNLYFLHTNRYVLERRRHKLGIVFAVLLHRYCSKLKTLIQVNIQQSLCMYFHFKFERWQCQNSSIEILLYLACIYVCSRVKQTKNVIVMV